MHLVIYQSTTSNRCLTLKPIPMKTRIPIITVLMVLFVIPMKASYYNTQKAVTFVENGITFSVFENGAFDFLLNSQLNTTAHINYYQPGFSISFNSGYNYDPYVQYDRYGAVIQVEHTPIYYDYYGRVRKIGAININYYNQRLYSIGGMYLHYAPTGYYSHYSGYVNSYNRYYVYHPYHNHFIMPYASYAVVRSYAYRNHYHPKRYSYYRDNRYAYKHPNKYKHYSASKRTVHKTRTHKNYERKNTYDYRRSVATNDRSSSNRRTYTSTSKKQYHRENVDASKSVRNTSASKQPKTIKKRMSTSSKKNTKRRTTTSNVSEKPNKSRERNIVYAGRGTY